MRPSSASGAMRRAIIAALAGLVGAVIPPHRAIAAEQTAVFGGPGGSPFIDRPPPNARIGAIRFGAGAWIDSVGVAYETTDGRRFMSTVHGGPGGAPCVVALESGEQILAIIGWQGQFVQAVRLITTKGVSRTCGDPSQGREFRIDVPPGHRVVGFAGRSGVYLDAIGLALAAAPNATPPPLHQAGPAAPQGPARLAERVAVRAGLSDARLDIRLTAPGSVQVNLGERPLRAGECFARSERLYSGSPVHPPKPRHIVDFAGLQDRKSVV